MQCSAWTSTSSRKDEVVFSRIAGWPLHGWWSWHLLMITNELATDFETNSHSCLNSTLALQPYTLIKLLHRGLVIKNWSMYFIRQCSPPLSLPVKWRGNRAHADHWCTLPSAATAETPAGFHCLRHLSCCLGSQSSDAYAAAAKAAAISCRVAERRLPLMH